MSFGIIRSADGPTRVFADKKVIWILAAAAVLLTGGIVLLILLGKKKRTAQKAEPEIDEAESAETETTEEE